MSEHDQSRFFERLGEILNAPLPGTRASEAPAGQAPPDDAGDDDEGSLLERIKDILSHPLPGSAADRGGPSSVDRQYPGSESPRETIGGERGAPGDRPVAEPPSAHASTEWRPGPQTPEIDEDDLDEPWWKQEWAAFRAHQARERNGLTQKQRDDLAKFTAYQEQERARFEAHQRQELELHRRQQHWRLGAWQNALSANPGIKPPPPPWGAPPGPPIIPGAGPETAGPPPWLRPPGPRRRR